MATSPITKGANTLLSQTTAEKAKSTASRNPHSPLILSRLWYERHVVIIEALTNALCTSASMNVSGYCILGQCLNQAA